MVMGCAQETDINAGDIDGDSSSTKGMSHLGPVLKEEKQKV